MEIKRKHRDILDERGEGHVRLAWIPAHVGILGNELADAEAKRAASSGNLEVGEVPFTDLSVQFKKNAVSSTRNTITDPHSPSGRPFFDNIYIPRQKPWFSGLGLKRAFIVTINRIRSNHYSLNSSLARKNLIERPDCECGAPQEDIDHVIWECPLRETHRPYLISGLRRLGYTYPIKVESLVKTPTLQSCNLILGFLSKSGLKV